MGTYVIGKGTQMLKRKIPSPSPAPTFRYLDLFCGSGGFSLGLERAGLDCVAAIDIDPDAIDVFKTNMPDVEHVLCRDLTTFKPEDLSDLIGKQKIDMIIGGPPCQGFSRVRKVDGANHGKRLIEDPRRLLYQNYLHYVEFFKPSIFIMENVPGIRQAAGGEFFKSIQLDARKLGYRVHATMVLAWQHGVPQKRERQLIIGTASKLPIFSTAIYVPQTHADPELRVNSRRPGEQRGGRGRKKKLDPPVTLWEAIGDLPPLQIKSGEFEADYDPVRGREHLEKYGRRFMLDVLEVHKSEGLTGHVSRFHSDRDLRDFDRLREGESSKQAIKRGEEMEFPYDRSHFLDRYTRQHRDHLCSTIVAHLSKDGLMYIHPTQRRSLTVREAARVQTFPDWFRFPSSKLIAYRLIGNAVPPLIAQAIGKGVKQYLSAALPARTLSPMPVSPKQAVEWLTPAIDVPAGSHRLRGLSMGELKKAWFSVGFLHNWLHPDGVGDNGDEIEEKVEVTALLAAVAPQIAAPAYVVSGWPLQLVPLAREAERRFRVGQLRFDEYYYSDAQVSGWEWCRKNRRSEWARKITN
jgi:DNA (cytosine-5)-methyltransferase 1